jgi:putative hydrolase of the HAD superfamily
MRTPRGFLLDLGGTLIREDGYDLRAGNEWLLARAAHLPAGVTLDAVVERASKVAAQVSSRRDTFGIETPWIAMTLLIHGYLGVRFDAPLTELELGFWRASVRASAMPGAARALEQFHRWNLPAAVVSNCSFREHVVRDQLSRHGLLETLVFVMSTADYAVRKPNVLLFETAAAKLGVAAREIWFVGDRLDTDVAGATAAGMTSVWLRPAGNVSGGGADIVVDTWDELVERARVSRSVPG